MDLLFGNVEEVLEAHQGFLLEVFIFFSFYCPKGILLLIYLFY